MPWLHGLRPAEQLYRAVDEVPAQFKKTSAFVLRLDGTFFRTSIRIDGAAHHEDFAEPAFARRIQSGIDPLVPPPHVAGLQQQLFSACLLDEFLERSPFIAGR